MTSQTKSRGFTIVELLIVIVVIAILAAITIVAYNGITARANTTSAKAAAGTAVKKIEAYNADSTSATYPAYPRLLTTAAPSATYQLTGITFTATEITGANAPLTPSTLNYYSCTNGGAVSYFDYSSTPKAWVQMFTGGATAATCTYKAETATT